MNILIRNKFLVHLIAGLAATLVLSLFLILGFWQTAQYRLEDIGIEARLPSNEVVIVKIDDASLQEIGRWPWDRGIIAELINKLAEANVVGVDIGFFEGSEKDEFLQEAISDNIILSAVYQDFEMDDGVVGKNPLLPVVDGRAGYTNIYTDDDGVVRGFFDVKGELKSFAGEITGREIPGGRRLIGWTGQHKSYSARDVLNGNVDFSNKTVLIGGTAVGLFDIKQTPFGKLAGVEVQASIIESALNDYWLLREENKYVILNIMIFALLVSLSIYFFGFLASIIIAFLIFAGYIFTSVYYYDKGIVLNLFFPLLSLPISYTFTAIVVAVSERLKHAYVSELFGKYISSEIAAELLKNPKRAAEGEEKILTVMFTDIRGFTGISEKMKPKELVKMLNKYLGAMTEIIIANKGVVDKYIGDAIMAFWNAPVEEKDHAKLAVKAASEMQKKVSELNKNAKQEVHVGIGISTGYAVVGSTGTEHRLEYTALGDSVNVASRLCSNAKADEILVSEDTFKLAKVEAKRSDRIKVKGREEAVKVYFV